MSSDDSDGTSLPNTTISSGWFTESSVLWPGQRFSLALSGLSPSSILQSCITPYQSILVFDSAQHGRVMCLDGVIQTCTSDVRNYSEMMVHVPFLSLPYPPRSVLIVGGGDGAVLTEVLRHPGVEKVVVVEIDPGVIETARRHFPAIVRGSFDDPRVSVVHSDAADYLGTSSSSSPSPSPSPSSVPPSTFDVIINDASDPCGPSERLYSPAFFRDMRRALSPGGVVCSQVRKSRWKTTIRT